MNSQEVVFAYVGAFVDELARAGLRHVCVAPGSRSTPLAMMLARHPDIRVWMHLDERSAAFFALGMAKASRQPVAVVCTSGTAAANFLPAVVEARYGRVPLVVLTADRPPELREIGAPQTIDQLHLYGAHAKWFVEVALPEATPDLLRYARTLAGRAVATAAAAPAGPVHLNLPFREPLVPLPATPPEGSGAGLDLAWHGRANRRPYAAAVQAPRVPEAELVEALAATLELSRRGLIICGPQDDPALAGEVARLARRLGYPLLADPLSLVRCGEHDRTAVIDSYDAFLRDGRVVERLAPEVVLRFGAMPTSKPVLLYLQRHPEARQVLIDGGDGWLDPTGLASDVIHADPVQTCAALNAVLGEGDGEPSPWFDTWREIDRRSGEAIEHHLRASDELFEGRVFAELAGLLPDGATLWAGSSMPVRDLDTFFPASGRRIRFLANRGANGIDGVVSSALGASAAVGGPLVLAIGDLSFYHDLNGLLAAKLHRLDATIVLLNNDGGGIFSFLPQAAYPDQFEQLFGTPHGLDFRPAVEMYGGSFARVDSWEAFRAAVRAGIETPGLSVVEVRTDRARNVDQHRAVWRAVTAALPDEVVTCPPSR